MSETEFDWKAWHAMTIALHEAAHAVIEIVTGWHFKNVCLAGSPECSKENAGVLNGANPQLWWEYDHVPVEATDSKILVILAGSVAARKHNYLRRINGWDRIHLKGLAYLRHGNDIKARMAYVRQRRRVTQKLVNKHWDSIEKVAAKLLETKILSEFAVRELMPEEYRLPKKSLPLHPCTFMKIITSGRP